MADDAAVAQFMSVTGATEEDAAFYLGSAEGNVETAVDSFFSTGGGEAVAEADDDMDAEPAPAPSAPSATASGAAIAGEIAREIAPTDRRKCCAEIPEERIGRSASTDTGRASTTMRPQSLL